MFDGVIAIHPTVLTSVRMFDGDPTVGPRVVRLDDVRRTAAAPATDDEHHLVRDPRTSDRIRQVDLLTLLHVEIVQELDRLDDDRLAQVVLVDERMFLTTGRSYNAIS